MSPGGEKARLAARVESQFASLVDLCRSLVRIDSTNPPGDTAAVVEAIEAALGATAGIEHRRVVGRAPVVNLVARVRGAGPGRRLVLNGHLDTFPIGEARWQHHPLGADLENGRIDGRGACDMKAGVAALVLAFVTLAEFRDAWGGELVLALIGDEETGGRWGTQYLLANVEEAVGDAMLNADTGSPRVVRVCEKDNVWVELEATGVANHAVHVHLGRNAVDALVDALGAVRALAALAPSLPAAVERTIAEAKAVSEAESGEGEAETLRRITVNIGRIEGGIGVNTIPDPRAAPLRLTSHVSRLAMLASLPIPNRIGSTAKCPRSDQQRPHQYSPNNENRQVVSPILRAYRCGPGRPRKRRAHRAKYRQLHRTPWRLVTSLPHHRGAGTRIKRIYAQRMQIEETIRDLKSQRFGFALRYARTKRPERLEALLLVAALATFLLWLLGLAASDRQWTRHFQANTERCRTVLSTVFLGQQLWRNHRFKATIAELFDALKRLKLLVIQEAHYA